MAYLRRHKRSPYWYLKRRDLDTGHWGEESTGLRIDNSSDTRKAQRAAEKASVEEKRVGAPSTSPAFLAWVPNYMASHWPATSGSSIRYRAAWQSIKQFLAEHDIVYPRQIRYQHGDAYMRWRKATAVHGHSVSHNTALLELKFLSQLMNEAKRLEHLESNPIEKLGIIKEAPKESRELKISEIKKVRGVLKKQPRWMRDVFEIGVYTGCRFSEASIPMENIDFRKNTIRMRDAKRKETDKRKYFTVPIAPELRPVLMRLKQSGAEVTAELSQDKNGRMNKVLKRTLGDDVSFRCLRVTFITWCARSGMSESEAMRLVNHSSEPVHRIYSKLNVEDARESQAKIRFPPGLFSGR